MKDSLKQIYQSVIIYTFLIVFNLTGLKQGEKLIRGEKSYKAQQHLNETPAQIWSLLQNYIASCRRHKTGLSMGINPELSSGAGSVGKLSLHKKNVLVNKHMVK